MSCFSILLVNSLERRKAHRFRKSALKQEEAGGDHSTIPYKAWTKRICWKFGNSPLLLQTFEKRDNIRKCLQHVFIPLSQISRIGTLKFNNKIMLDFVIFDLIFRDGHAQFCTFGFSCLITGGFFFFLKQFLSSSHQRTNSPLWDITDTSPSPLPGRCRLDEASASAGGCKQRAKDAVFRGELQTALWIISSDSDTSMWKWVRYQAITLKAQRFSKNPKIYRHH